MLSESDQSIADSFKRLMRDRNLPVYQAIVFGSRARGDAEPDSDLDVLVIVNELDRTIRREISHCAWEAGFDDGVVVQSVVMTRAEAEDSPEQSSLFMQAIGKEGVPI